MDKAVPTSWMTVPLRSLVRLVPRTIDDELPAYTEVAYYPAEAVGDASDQVDSLIRRLDDIPKTSVTFSEGDVLFPKNLAWLQAQRIGIAGELVNGLGFTSPEFFVLRPVGPVIPRWLWYCLLHPTVHDQARPMATGASGRFLLSMDTIGSLEIPLPAISEQRRLVSILDHSLTLRRIRNEVKMKLHYAVISVFRKICGSPEDLWHNARLSLGDVAYVTVGGTPSRSDPDNFGGGIPWVRSGELNDTDVFETEQTLSEKGLSNSTASLLPPGTILLGMNGGAAGRTGRLLRHSATNQAVAGIESSDAKSFPEEFIWAWLRVSYHRIRSLARGSIQQNLNSRIVQDIPIPEIPGSVLTRLLSAIKVLSEAQATTIAQLNQVQSLVSALHHKAVNGELSYTKGTARVPGLDMLYEAENLRANLLAKAKSRPVWPRMSATQRRIWEVSLGFTQPFTLEQIQQELKTQFKTVVNREHLRGALDMLTLLGVVIRDARRGADLWRRPDPVVDSEVEV